MIGERFRLPFHRKKDADYLSGDPFVSVYIPTHNRCDLLMDRALPSVLAQTYRNIEIVVALHGCTDGTLDAIHGLYLSGEYRLDWIEVERTRYFPPTAENYWFAGRVEPANAALKRCAGKWIATIDDDDIWEPDCLERLLRFAQEGNYEFVSATGMSPKGRIEPYDVEGVRVGSLQTWLYRDYLKFMRFNPKCWKKSWNRVCDTDLQQRFRKVGVRMGYLDEPLYRVTPRPGTMLTGIAAYIADREKTEAHYAF